MGKIFLPGFDHWLASQESVYSKNVKQLLLQCVESLPIETSNILTKIETIENTHPHND